VLNVVVTGGLSDSVYNRRITADTEWDVTGPARGPLQWMADLQKILKALVAKGTWINCGNGTNTWGTYLTCEENFTAIFTANDKKLQNA